MGYSVRKRFEKSIMQSCAEACLEYNKADINLSKLQKKFTGCGDSHEQPNKELDKQYYIMVELWEKAERKVAKAGKAYKKYLNQKLDNSEAIQDKSK